MNRLPYLVLCVLSALVLALSPSCSCTQSLDGGQGQGDTQDGGGNGTDRPPLPGLISLQITPGASTLTVDNLQVPKTQALVALAKYEGGKEEDVSTRVNWRLDNPTLGTISQGGLFTTSNQGGGITRVTATSGDKSASAEVKVLFKPIITTSDAPPGAEMTLPPGNPGVVLAGKSPIIVYPSDRTLFPRNMYKILFQWDTGMGNDLFRLEFKNDVLNLSVYTTRDRFEPSAAQWAFLANSGSTVTWTVYGTTKANPTTVYRSSSVELSFTKTPVEGAIYYWSTTVAGVRRATVSDAAPVDFLTPTQTGKCVACHTLSRNGKRLAADVGGHVLGVVDVKNPTPPVINWTQGIAVTWTTFNPDATRIVTAQKGVLTLRDGQTGQALGTVTTGAGRYGTYPDWSPDGKTLAFAMSAATKDRGINTSSIALADYNGTGFSNVRVLVASAAKDDTLYYPSFSPDSKWIAYARATGSSDNNETARLYLVAADGSSPPIELTRGNTVVNNQTLSGNAAQIGNTFPTWAPTKPGEPAFVAFSSVRAYGKVYKANSLDQLWVMGLDLSVLPGKDPSYSAFRLPFQDLDENTHRPFWAEDALAPPPPPPDGGMPMDGGMCVPANGDCQNGVRCCPGFYCTEDNGAYLCKPLG